MNNDRMSPEVQKLWDWAVTALGTCGTSAREAAYECCARKVEEIAGINPWSDEAIDMRSQTADNARKGYQNAKVAARKRGTPKGCRGSLPS